MAINKIKTLKDFVGSGIPKAKINNIMLETGAAEVVHFKKDPHVNLPEDKWQHFLSPQTEEIEQTLKVSLLLTLEGVKQRSSKSSNKLFSVWLDKLDLMNMIKVCVYEIDQAAYEEVSANLGKAELYLNDFTNYIKKHLLPSSPSYNAMSILETRKTNINVLEELNKYEAASGREKEKYMLTLADGTIGYQIPINLEPYVHNTKNPNYLGYLVTTSLDKDAIKQHIAATFSENDAAAIDSTLEALTSEMSSMGAVYDIVFQNGALNGISFLLQRIDNGKLWFGDYHVMDDDTIMTGLEHGDTSISSADRDRALRVLNLPNMKVTDLRDDDELEKVLVKDLYELEDIYENFEKTTKQPKITDSKIKEALQESYTFSFMSRLGTSAPGYLFAFDKSKILYNNSLFKKISKSIKEAVFRLTTGAGLNQTQYNDLSNRARPIIDEILNLSEIREVKIYRKRVSLNETGQNKLGTKLMDQNSYINFVLDADIENSYEDAKEVPIAVYSESGASTNIKRINNLNFSSDAILEKSFVFLSFKDNNLIDKNIGQYQYRAEIIIEDGIKKFLEKRLSDLYVGREKINDYISFIDSNPQLYYNDILNQFNTEAIGDNFSDSDFATALAALAKVYELFTLTEAMASSVLFEKLINISNPYTGNYQGLLKLAKIYDTFIEKFQKIARLNKKILKFSKTNINDGTGLGERSVIYDTIAASEGSISSLVDNNKLNVYSKTAEGMHDLIKISENIPHVCDNESFKFTGYEYVFNNASNQVGTGIREISSQLFENRSVAEIDKYYNRQGGEPGLWADIDSDFALSLYRTTFFSPLFTAIQGTKHTTYSHSTDEELTFPVHEDYSLYKNIILDIIKFYISNYAHYVKSDTDVLDQVKKLLTIASHFGIYFSDTIYKQLGFIVDPVILDNAAPQSPLDFIDSADKEEDDDTSESEVLQSEVTEEDLDQEQQNLDELIDPAPPFGQGNMPQTGFDIKVTDELDSLLFGILNHIILKNNDKLSIFLDQAAVMTMSANLDTPNGIKSLFLNYNVAFGSKKSILRAGGLDIAGKTFEEYSLSLETFGWWWYNYCNIVEVRYISRIDDLFNPQWDRLTATHFSAAASQGKALICKIERYSNRMFGVQDNKFLDLPLFNKYFIINPASFQSPPAIPDTIIEDEIREHIEEIREVEEILGDTAKTDINKGLPEHKLKEKSLIELTRLEDEKGGLREEEPVSPLLGRDWNELRISSGKAEGAYAQEAIAMLNELQANAPKIGYQPPPPPPGSGDDEPTVNPNQKY